MGSQNWSLLGKKQRFGTTYWQKKKYKKVSKSQKQIMATWIRSKNERWGIFQYIKLPRRSFFGRIQDAIICFWDLLTISKTLVV